MFILFIILNILQLTVSYSKYGRSCEDQNCLTGEKCVIIEDKCTSYIMQESGQCGKRPTCISDGNSVVKDCSTYQCPPTHRCFMDGSTPKCVPGGSNRPNTKVISDNKNYAPSAPSAPYAPPPLYPQIPSTINKNPLYPGATEKPKPRPGQQYPSGPGYSGGRIGSGYPGQNPANYPQRPQYPYQNPYQPQSPYQTPYQPQYPNGGIQPNNQYNPYGSNNNYKPPSTSQKSSSSLFGGDTANILLNLGKRVLGNYLRNQQPNNNNHGYGSF